jgi:hypothetical protein
MDEPLVDRRVDRRFGQPAIAGAQAILRPGYSVSLVDLSAGGALIEGPRPLRPGTHVHLQIVANNRRLGLGARVLRCAVSSLERGIQYRGALKFDHRCTDLWEGSTLAGYPIPGEDRVISNASSPDVPRPDAAQAPNAAIGTMPGPSSASDAPGHPLPDPSFDPRDTRGE